jgi:hypothetical protein
LKEKSLIRQGTIKSLSLVQMKAFVVLSITGKPVSNIMGAYAEISGMIWTLGEASTLSVILHVIFL